MAGEDDIIAAMDAAEDAGPAEDRAVTPLDRICAFLLRNDIGNADRLIARFGEDLAFHPALGWLVWDGHRWDTELGKLAAERKAQSTARAIYAEARALPEPDMEKLIEEAQERGLGGKDLDKWVRGKIGAHKKAIDGLLKFARASGNQGKVTAMLEAAAPHRTRRPEEFDARPFIFNAGNRALHLAPDGAVAARPHHRGDLLTKIGGCGHHPKAACARFTAFLERIQPAAEMRAYLQRVAGYLLTGDISEQAMFVFWGAGSNGKGTLLNAWRHVLGEYAITAKIETFGDSGGRKTGSEASPDVARMRGARMIGTTDAPTEFTLGEGMVKQATGEEPITARKLHRDDLEFDMSGKVIMPCNPKPRIVGKDDGIWRRVNLVPFAVQIPPGERDHGLKAALREEAPGILNWMLEGYATWRAKGLAPPEAVRAATDDYRHESDPMGEFLTVWTDRGPTQRATSKELFEKYVSYCQDNAYTVPKSGVAFGKALKARGFDSMKSGTKVWLGIGLRTTPREDARADEMRRREMEEINAANRAAYEADRRPGSGGAPHPDDDASQDREGGAFRPSHPSSSDARRADPFDDPLSDFDEPGG